MSETVPLPGQPPAFFERDSDAGRRIEKSLKIAAAMGKAVRVKVEYKPQEYDSEWIEQVGRKPIEGFVIFRPDPEDVLASYYKAVKKWTRDLIEKLKARRGVR